MFGLNEKELKILKKLNSPRKIQDFLDKIEINYEPNGDSCKSPRKVLREGNAHCMEGAMLAAAALKVNGFKPLVVDLTSNKKDFDHVVVVFQENGYWGAISKTNHAALRYRDPIYKSIRELVMSYFNEYFLSDGSKTLRSYTRPINLNRFDKKNWITSEEDIWYIPEYLADAKHINILTKSQIKKLRKADPIEIETGRIVEWRKEGRRAVKNNFKVDKKGKAEV